jgi:DNA repair protein RecN (Recombination protein N)
VLIELSIKSFALIDDLTVSLQPGLSVLTGETGAGKSIMIDALSAALGERVSAETIRTGASLATVDAVFEAADSPKALAAALEAGLCQPEETLIVLSRQIAPGRSQCRVNGRPVTLAVLQEISRHLVDVHGQHEHQALIHEENHLEFLDTSGGQKHQALRQAYEDAYQEYRQATERLRSLRDQSRDRAQRLDVLRFQVEEITQAELRLEEEEELAAERKRLGSVEKLRELADEAHMLLAGLDDLVGATAALQEAADKLRRLTEIDDSLAVSAEEVTSAASVAAEAERTLSSYLADLESDPQRLERIEERLELLSRLKRKYGDTIADVLSYEQRAAAELDEIVNFEEQEASLTAAVEKARLAAGSAGWNLSRARTALAAKLSKAVSENVKTLGMPAARFAVEVAVEEDPHGLPVPDGSLVSANSRGLDHVRFLFSANTGEDLRALIKVASGGELSRIMLAFKSLCSRGTEIPTIIFDEVDTGIGGQTAHKVGEKLADLAQHAQVLCVTHLPQIAGLADHHLHVEKAVSDGRTMVSVKQLPSEQRVEELSRMFGAAEDDAAARQHAENVLKKAASRRAAS